METTRLYFRERTQELLEQIFAQPVEEQLAFFGYEDTQLLEFDQARMNKRINNAEAGWKEWDLIEKESKAVVGGCNFHNWYTEHERAEIGYFANHKFRGKGYMHEAVQHTIIYGFNEMQLNRIEAFITPENLPSQKLIKRLGFTQEGLLKQHYKFNGKIHDSMVFALLKEEFENRLPKE